MITDTWKYYLWNRKKQNPDRVEGNRANQYLEKTSPRLIGDDCRQTIMSWSNVLRYSPVNDARCEIDGSIWVASSGLLESRTSLEVSTSSLIIFATSSSSMWSASKEVTMLLSNCGVRIFLCEVVFNGAFVLKTLSGVFAAKSSDALQLLCTEGTNGVSIILNNCREPCLEASFVILHLSRMADKSCTMMSCFVPIAQVPKFLGEGLSSSSSKESTSWK